MKRWIALALTICMLVTIMPLHARAENGSDAAAESREETGSRTTSPEDAPASDGTSPTSAACEHQFGEGEIILAPTCTEEGAQCFVCVLCGERKTEPIPATGHSFRVTGNRLSCHCGETVNDSGLHTVEGKTYYTRDGILTTGWVQTEGEWYYFDESYAGISGRHSFGGTEYSFDNGLVQGFWQYDGAGYRYYYGPGFYAHSRNEPGNFIWATIAGGSYAFDNDGHRFEGYGLLRTPDGTAKLYEFTQEGLLVGEYSPGTDYTGIFVCSRTTTYLKNGLPYAAGLVKQGEDYYYINSNCEAVTGNYDVTRPNGLLLPGFYRFGRDGRMINPPVYADGPNNNGFFYLNGVRQNCYKLIRFENHYYFITDYNKYARNVTLFLSEQFVGGSGLTPGNYYFDGDGVMSVKDGPDEDGYFYLDGVRQSCYKLIQYQGDYYFISDAHKYARDVTLYLNASFLVGTGLEAGYYYFDAGGRLKIKNGPDADGYFYLDGVRQRCYQLIKFEGAYYFISDGHRYAKDCTIYLGAQFVQGTDLKPGYYSFGPEGRMDVKSGPNEDGYFYLDGVRQRCYQLIQFEGAYYFISDGHRYAKDCTIYLGARFVEGTDLKPGYYSFGPEGRMDVKSGPNEDGYFYLDGVRQRCYQLIQFEGAYYFISDGHRYAKDCTIYLGARFVEGTDLKPGYYSFGPEGRMDLKSGPNEDGYFYLDGVRQSCYQLIRYEGFYYFISDGHRYARNCTLYLGAQFVQGTDLKPGYYFFGPEGRMDVKNGPDEDGYFYLDGVRQSCYQLIRYEGFYYFISDGHRYAKDCTLYLSDRFVAGTELAVGYYSFGPDGRLDIKNGPNQDGYFYVDGVKQQAYQMIKYKGDYYFVYNGNRLARNVFMDISGEYLEGTDLRHWYYEFDEEGRMVGYYDGIPNGRDIGAIKALRTMDGRDVRSGLLIRGCELENANYYFPEDILEVGIERLKNEFHVKFDMDLRAPYAVGKDLLGEGVTHKIYNMVLYDQVFTDAGKAKVREVFTDLANPDNYPMYLHCTHGIDRTGTVCFLLEMALGIPYDMLWKEYMYSVGAHDGSILKVWNGVMDNYPGGDSREKAIAFLKDCGVTQAQIDALYQIYLED